MDCSLEFDITAPNLEIDIQSQTLDTPVISYFCAVSDFLPDPDEEDYTQSDYFYFGWISINGKWLVRRQSRIDASCNDAVVKDNTSYTDFSSAWINRYNLEYL